MQRFISFITRPASRMGLWSGGMVMVLLSSLVSFTPHFGQCAMLELHQCLAAPAGTRMQGRQDTFRVLSWNIYMLPPLVKFTGKRKRARKIVALLKERAYDVVVFQEAFHAGVRRLMLKQGLDSLYPHRVGPANRGGFSLKINSGVWILSRHPLRKLGSTQFEAVATWDDKLARKGGLLVQCTYNGQPVQILGTHLNAGGPRRVRLNQMKQLRDSLIRRHSRRGVPLLICGDMNTARSDSALYSTMVRVYDTEIPRRKGPLRYTANGPRNDLKPDFNRRIIDYVFVRPQGVELKAWNRVRAFRRRWSQQHQDLSDHYAIETRVVFP